MDQNKILKMAITHYGKEHQLRKLQEELGELISAIHRMIDNRGSGVDNYYEEFADVEILMGQLKLTMNKNKLRKNYKYKINRLFGRMKNDIKK